MSQSPNRGHARRVTTDEAVTLVTTSAQLTSAGHSRRVFVGAANLADRVSQLIDGAEGVYLAQAIDALPKTKVDWEAWDMATYNQQTTFDLAVAAIFATAATRQDIAVQFCKELRRDHLANPDGALLSESNSHCLSTALSRAWNNPDHDVDAILVMLREISPYVNDPDFEKVLDSRKIGIIAHPPLDDKSRLDLLKCNYVLNELAADESNAVRQVMIDQCSTSIAPRIRYAEREVHQARLRELQRLTSRKDTGQIGWGSLEDMDAFIATCREIEQLDPGNFAAILVDGLHWRSSDPDAPCRHRAREIIDDVIDDAIGRLSTDPALKLPTRLADALNSELSRRMRESLVFEGDELIVAERPFSVAADKLLRLKVWEADKLITSIRRGLDMKIAKHRDYIAALDRVGIRTDVLPSTAGATVVKFERAHLEYPDVDAMLADVDAYLRIRSTDRTHSRIGRHIEMDDVSPRQLEALRQAWAEHRSNGRLSQIDTELVYERSGVTVLVRSSPTGRGLWVDMKDHRTPQSASDPSRELIRMAEALGKTDEIRYEGPPSVEFHVQPSLEELQQMADDRRSIDPHTTLAPNGHLTEGRVSVSLDELARVYGQVIDREISFHGPMIASETPTQMGSLGKSSRVLDVGDVTFTYSDSTRRGDDRTGEFDGASLNLLYRAERSDSGAIRFERPIIGIALTSGAVDVDPDVASRRARDLARVVTYEFPFQSPLTRSGWEADPSPKVLSYHPRRDRRGGSLYGHLPSTAGAQGRGEAVGHRISSSDARHRPPVRRPVQLNAATTESPTTQQTTAPSLLSSQTEGRSPNKDAQLESSGNGSLDPGTPALREAPSSPQIMLD